MAKKTVRLPVTVVVPCPKNSLYKPADKDGNKEPINIYPLHIEAGQPVELDADEADALVAKFGTYQPPAAGMAIAGTPSPVKVHSARG